MSNCPADIIIDRSRRVDHLGNLDVPFFTYARPPDHALHLSPALAVKVAVPISRSNQPANTPAKVVMPPLFHHGAKGKTIDNSLQSASNGPLCSEAGEGLCGRRSPISYTRPRHSCQKGRTFNARKIYQSTSDPFCTRKIRCVIFQAERLLLQSLSAWRR